MEKINLIFFSAVFGKTLEKIYIFFFLLFLEKRWKKLI